MLNVDDQRIALLTDRASQTNDIRCLKHPHVVGLGGGAIAGQGGRAAEKKQCAKYCRTCHSDRIPAM
jgi:hypothetical protein